MTSCFLKHTSDWDINIPETKENEGVIWFVIQMRVGSVKWFLEHRYNEFAELHKNLVANHGVSKDLLPPKIFFKKMSREVIEMRRNGLEIYINSVLKFLSNTMPPPLVMFLKFDKYDMWFLFRKLASCIRINNWIENPPSNVKISVIEVSALSERLKLPCPPIGVIDSQVDFCTVLEFFTSVEYITVIGEDKDCFGASNISYKNLPFELSSFRSLKNIGFSNVHMANLVKADDARAQIFSLNSNGCKLRSIAEVLMCDNIHKKWKPDPSGTVWHALRKVDFSHNYISVLDSGLELMPHATEFNVSHNQISSLCNISKLTNLKVLKLSHNRISSVIGDNIHLPFLNYLDLSNNEIVQIVGVSQFPSLEVLNLSFNRLDNFDELDNVSSLPNILNVSLIGNPISQKTDYRVKTLGKFGKRTSLICLDNEQCTSHELELIALVQAIKFVQEGRSLSYNKNLSLNI